MLPNLLIPGIRQATARSPARVVLVANLMTQPGETDRMDALEHLDAIEQHAGERLVDCVLVNATEPPPALLDHYAETGAELVRCDREAFAARGVELVEADLLAAGDFIRHDPAKLSRAVLQLVAARRA